MTRLLLTTLTTLLSAAALHAQTPKSSLDAAAVPRGKQTTLGLYLTAAEAYDAWKADPQGVKILDVRTPEEHLFVGHPPMAFSVPLKLQSYAFDDKGKLPMKNNPEFVEQAKTVVAPDDTVLVMCRSGGRGAQAVNLLAEAGFAKVYNIVDGMEGDVVDDPDSRFHGLRKLNGWKNAGLPWTCDVEEPKTRWPKAPE